MLDVIKANFGYELCLLVFNKTVVNTSSPLLPVEIACLLYKKY